MFLTFIVSMVGLHLDLHHHLISRVKMEVPSEIWIFGFSNARHIEARMLKKYSYDNDIPERN